MFSDCPDGPIDETRMSVKSEPFCVSESRSATRMIECAKVDGPANAGCIDILNGAAGQRGQCGRAEQSE